MEYDYWLRQLWSAGHRSSLLAFYHFKPIQMEIIMEQSAANIGRPSRISSLKEGYQTSDYYRFIFYFYGQYSVSYKIIEFYIIILKWYFERFFLKEIFWLQIIMLWHDQYGIDRLSFLLRLLSNWYQVYAISGLLIFALIGWTLVLGFRCLGNQLDNILQTTRNNTLLIDDLFKWKELHILLCVTVDEINNCLGPLLLIWISHVFVSFISIPFYLLEGLQESNTNTAMLVTNFSLLFELLVHLLILTGIPSRIWHEVL